MSDRSIFKVAGPEGEFEWGVFVGAKDKNETHVAPSKAGLNVSNHVFEGIACWCQPRRDSAEQANIIHNQAS